MSSIVSINTNNNSAIKNSLCSSLDAATLAATKMATGQGIVSANESPTSFVIGLGMRSDLQTLKIVSQGIQQSQSMMSIAESGIKSIYDTVAKMKDILTQAKLGYMTDSLVVKTLSPAYVALKSEINRIADSVTFNGQSLLNGKGGSQEVGNASNISQIASAYTTTPNTHIALASFDSNIPILDGLQASTVTNGQVGAVTFTLGNAIKDQTPQVIGGELTSDNANNVYITGATLVFNNIGVTDSNNNQSTGTLTIKGVDLKFQSDQYEFSKGTISSNAAAGAPTITSTLDPNQVSFTVISGAITEVSGFSELVAGTPGTLQAISNNTASTVSNLNAQYVLSGGSDYGSNFSFVTGTNLNNDIVMLTLPNFRLDSNSGVLGMVDVLNTQNNTSSTKPTTLTDLTTVTEAGIDIPLVEALLEKITNGLTKLGANETQLINIESALVNSIQQVDNAQGVFMNADLASETEAFTKANVQTFIAISVLKQMNEVLESLKRLVS